MMFSADPGTSTRHCPRLISIHCLMALASVTAASAPLKADEQPALRPEISQPAPGVSLRALCVTPSGAVFAGGTGGTLIRSDDGGKNWTTIASPAFGDLDFRDIEAFNHQNLILMAAGPADRSVVLISADGGRTWNPSLRNTNPAGFFNGLAVADNGLAVLCGDQIDGRHMLMLSQDFGRSWKALKGPPAQQGEYGFAASGTGISLRAGNEVRIVTGGSVCRMHTSVDLGESWTTVQLPIRAGTQGSGAFSAAVAPEQDDGEAARMIVVGGDYLSPELSDQNAAWTTDGIHWNATESPLQHKACIRFLDQHTAVACGRTGVALTSNNGRTWEEISPESFYTMAVDKSSHRIWSAGNDGRVAVWRRPSLEKAD